MRGRAAVGMDDHRGDAHHPVQPVFESSERQTVNDPRVYGSQRRFYDPAAADVVTCHHYGWCVAVATDTIYLHFSTNHGGTPSQTSPSILLKREHLSCLRTDERRIGDGGVSTF